MSWSVRSQVRGRLSFLRFAGHCASGWLYVTLIEGLRMELITTRELAQRAGVTTERVLRIRASGRITPAEVKGSGFAARLTWQETPELLATIRENRKPFRSAFPPCPHELNIPWSWRFGVCNGCGQRFEPQLPKQYWCWDCRNFDAKEQA